MHVSVSVRLDDGTEISRTYQVDSGGNPAYWGSGLVKGVDAATEDIKLMMHAQYGTSRLAGIHVTKPAARR